MRYVIGVDVGTGSARAGLFSETGQMLATASHSIPIKHPRPEWCEQSSTRIWTSVCRSVRKCMASTSIRAEQVSGISYSATCSLVLLDRSDQPLLLSEGEEAWNIIVWMDHRAIAEAAEVTQSGSKVLNNLGGTISPEMEIPKLMWLKRNRPDLWTELGFAGDLTDYLTYRSSGSVKRSVCTLGCKWTYDPDKAAWDKTFLKKVGLEDLMDKARLPEQAVSVGSPLGFLRAEAAKDLGLTTKCRVATGLIDAHAGALGTIGLFCEDHIQKRMALIAGTSNCHIALSKTRWEIPGVWGPYGGAVVDGMWCTEGGQSASGFLLDYIISLLAPSQFKQNPHDVLAQDLIALTDQDTNFAGDIEVIPDFIGNRAPFANPELRGTISGLTIEDPLSTFRKVYWATAASIAYGTKLIIDQLNNYGYEIDTIHLSGGHKKSKLMIDMYADATECDVVISKAEEPVLLGAAIAAFSQFEENDSVSVVTSRMTKEIKVQAPRVAHRDMHRKRYQRFLKYYKRHGFPVP